MFSFRPSYGNHNELIDALRDERRLRSRQVEAVMRQVDRARYVLPGSSAYTDAPQSIGYNATISAPHMHAEMLEILSEALRRGPKRRALDVGAGSGYMTACMALLQGERGLVVGIEHIPELAQFAEANVRRDKPELLDSGRVRFVVGDGRLGYPSEAPYDAIHVGAGSSEEPKKLQQQLAVGGRIVVPVGPTGFQQLEVMDRMSDGTMHLDVRDWVAFVPLTDANKQWRRSFSNTTPSSGLPELLAARRHSAATVASSVAEEVVDAVRREDRTAQERGANRQDVDAARSSRSEEPRAQEGRRVSFSKRRPSYSKR